jgi:hypothetical protein
MNNSLESTLQRAMGLAEISVQLAADIERALGLGSRQDCLWQAA